MKTVLSIAGLDPTGYAGSVADALTINAFGLTPLTVITAVTAQTLTKVSKAEPVTAALLKSELTEAVKVKRPSSVKIGMLGTAENVRVLRNFIKKNKLKNIILDPVITSSSGKVLLEKKGVVELKRLLPLVTVITPNTDEAALLSGVKKNGLVGAKKAAEALFGMGAKNVIITGGHLKGAPIDILFNGKNFTEIKGRRIKASRGALHGTGCIYSSALASNLAKGRSIKVSAINAKKYLEEVIKKRR